MAANNCQFHQQGNFLHVLVKAQGVREEDLDVQIQRRRLTVILKRVTMVEGLLQGQVDVGNCKVNIHSDYVEIKLRKANPEENWPQLLLGVPDMMTSLQRPDPAQVSPEHSPTRAKPITTPKNVGDLGTSLSNLVHNVFGGAEDEMRDTSTSLSRASQREQ